MRQLKILLLTGVVKLFFVSCLYAQAPDTLWTKTYGDTLDEYGRAVEECLDGYLIVGYTESYGAGSDDFYLIKVNGDGDTLWTKTYGGTANERAFSMQQTSDSGYIITGFTSSFASGGSDVWLLKTDANGDTLWAKNYGGLTGDAAYCVRQTSDNGFIITGFSTVFGSGDQVYLIKTDQDGDTMWTKTYGGIDQDYGRSVQQTTDGGYIIAGYTYSFGVGNADVWLIKTDSIGDTLWTKTYGGNGDDHGFVVFQNPDNGYIIVGSTESFGGGYNDVYVLRTNPSGDTVWMRTYGGGSADRGLSAQKTYDGNLIVVGYTYSYSVGENDIYLLKINMDGDTLWTNTYGGLYYEYGYAVKQTSDEGYIIVGRTNSFGAGENDVYVIKTGPDVGIEEDQITKPKKQIPFLEVFPNPFSDKINIKYYIKQSALSGMKLRIYNVSGRQIKQLNHLTSAETRVQDSETRNIQQFNQAIWDGRDNKGEELPSGVYFLRFEAGGFNTTRKLLKVK